MKKNLILFLLILITVTLKSGIRMEGFYEAEFGTAYESDQFKWNN